MKYRILSPFLLLLTISACTTTNQVAPDHSTPLTSFPSVEPGSVTSVPSPQEQQENGTHASLGCPQPGMVYAEVLTPGYLILLEANNDEYEYHTDLQDTFTFCDLVFKESSSSKNTDRNVEDGWPNQTKDKDVIIVTPTPRK